MKEHENSVGYMHYKRLPLLGKVVRDFDIAVGKEGLQPAIKNLCKQFHIEVEAHGLSTGTCNVLKEKPVLLVVNHPHDIEPVPLLGVLPERSDIWLVSSNDLTTLGSHVSKRMIGVHISEEAREEGKFTARLGANIRFGPRYSRDIARRMNEESLNVVAVDKLRKGGMLVMFPRGVSKGSEWFDGVGHLVSHLLSNHEIRYGKAYIHGPSNYDLFRLIPGVNRLMPDIDVHFSETDNLNILIDGQTDPKVIKGVLQSDYVTWVNSLKY